MAFLSKANVPTSEKWERGMPRAAPSFPSCSPLGLLTLARPPQVQFSRGGGGRLGLHLGREKELPGLRGCVPVQELEGLGSGPVPPICCTSTAGHATAPGPVSVPGKSTGNHPCL